MVNQDCSITLNNLRRGEGGFIILHQCKHRQRIFNQKSLQCVQKLSYSVLFSPFTCEAHFSRITHHSSTVDSCEFYREENKQTHFSSQGKNWSLLHPPYSFEHAAWFPSPTYLPLTHTWFTFIMHFLFWNKNFELVFSI